MTERRSIGARALFLLALGCGPPAAAPASPSTRVAPREEHATQTPSCPPGIADLETALGSLAGAPVRDAAVLPVAANAPAIAIFPVLEITTDSMTLEGVRVLDSDLGPRLAVIVSGAAQIGNSAPPEL